MTSPADAKATRHVQGDGRPFGIARVTPRVVIRHSELESVLEGSNLSGDVRGILIARLIEILSLYLGPKILAENKVAHGRALELLEMISGNARKLDQYINELDNDILVLIDEQREALRGAEQVRHFSFLHFAPAIRTLSEAAAKVLHDLKPRGRGGQRKQRLDTAISALLQTLNACDVDVTTSDSGSRYTDRRHIGESGGDLIKKLFAHFDPHVTEAELVGSVERVRNAENAAP